MIDVFTSNPVSILIALTLFGIVAIILGVYVLYLISNSGSKNSQKEIERLAIDEAKKSVLETKQKINQTTDYFIEIWRKQFEETNQEVKLKTSEAVNQLINSVENKLASLDQEIKKEISKFSEVNSTIRDSLSGGIKEVTDEFSQELKQEVVQIYRSTEKVLKEQITDAQKEIEEYKKERFNDIDRRIYQTLGSVAKKTIGKTIDLSTHEELVMEALEKAKKENIF